MSLWLESWISSCGPIWFGYSAPLTAALRQSLFTPESVFQRFVAPFITLLLYTPGGWLFTAVCNTVWSGFWAIMPLGVFPVEYQVAFALMSFLKPIPLLTGFIRVAIEKTLTAGMDRDETYFWVFILFLALYWTFLTTVMGLNDLFFAAAFRAYSAFATYLVTVIGNAPESAGTAPDAPDWLSPLTRSLQKTRKVLSWIGLFVTAAIGPVASEFIIAALETKQYKL